jgi:alpha-1,2-mannosyltransferase
MPFARSALLEQGNTGWFKIQSVFSWVRMWGGGIELAYAAQIALALVIAAALVWLWRSAVPYPVKAAALLIGSLLATPFILDYDLMLLAPAIAFLAADGMRRGFGPYEKSMLAALWIAPLIARSAAQSVLLPLGVLAMLAAFALLLRRAIAERGPRPHGILDSAA